MAEISPSGVSASPSTPRAPRISGVRGSTSPSAATRRRPPNPRTVVVVPGRSGELGQPAALGEPHGRGRVRVHEHAGGRTRPPGASGPRAASHCRTRLRHVADPDHGDRLAHHVRAELDEVALHGLPGPPRRDPERLVVVAGGPAGGERVPEPESVLGQDGVGRVRQGRRALVGRHHQVRVVLVVHDDVRRVHDGAVHEVVGHVEHPAHEGHVLLGNLPLQRRGLGDVTLEHEPTLRTVGTITRSSPSAPSSAPGPRSGSPAGGRTSGCRRGRPAAAQMDGLHLGRVHEDLEEGVGLGISGTSAERNEGDSADRTDT